mmetsp:Transcript_20979/g.45495  ORF Transcript_20979/g.45495 Transcript_20979/m.45495 type:complete len:253 (+) Transcript_20979:80-838(+)|eukprot:CAMPEP_0172305422 /NCGR_PEP_ID=MMETSP1058-20130122/6719_1 /TAXON_ID=83371 /ORGANISM="Detonula confervacea, Strain CCMP 353" /LENGTH=252 /DNA_ID=CAMNT_0013017019 /DNA_START=106 /DNA_END=864 /DNA_ORIENTATION=-
MFQAQPILVAFFCVIACAAVDSAVGFAATKPVSITVPLSARHQTSLHAKKSNKKKSSQRAAQTTKGFGAPPPKLEDFLATLKTRVPEDADTHICPCGTGKVYGDCCGPLHRGDKPCLTMTDVLRSRYTAFSWRVIGYVMSTTHESCRDYREDKITWAKDLNKGGAGMFDSFEFIKLSPGKEVMNEDNENEGFLDFKVTLKVKKDENNPSAGQETVISERSTFLRDPSDGSWTYASGDVRSDIAGLEDTTLNA